MAASSTAKPLPGTQLDPLYPDSDGKPLGETGFHVNVTLYIYAAIREHFGFAKNAYIAADMFYYYEEGNPRANASPDVMVIKGVGSHERRSFRTWEEKALSCVIFEITSKNTWREDLGAKRALYARLGIKEYFVFDPEDRWIEPVLQGFRLEKQKYVEMAPGDDGSLLSKELRLRLVPEGKLLRLYNAKTAEPYLTVTEKIVQLREAHQRAEEERDRAEAERERAELERERAAESRDRAEKEHARAEESRERAEAAEAETTRLRALLEKLSKKKK